MNSLRFQRPRPRLLAAIAVSVAAAASALAVTAPAHAALTTVGPGNEIRIAISATSASICTLGFTGTNAADEPVGYTAGHCGSVGNQVYSLSGVNIGVIEKSASPPTGPGGVILDANAPDWATIRFNANADVGAGSGNVNPSKVGTAATGDAVCSQGRTTGWRCGEVTGVSGYWITTSIARDSGDSGGPLIRTSDKAALGVLSSTTTSLGFGSLGGGSGSSRYFSFAELLDRAGSGYSLATVGESVPDATLAPRNAPAPTRIAPADLPNATGV